MFVQLLCLLFCQAVLGAPAKPFYDTNNFEVIGRHFEDFLQEHNKVYDEAEKIQRFIVFIENVNKINEFNAQYVNTTFEITKFADWTEEETKSLRGFKVPIGDDNHNGDCKVLGDPTTKDAPAAFDWRDHGLVSPVKAQQTCGSCWAFSTTALVESRYLQKKKTVILSEQQLVDCDTQSSGCQGGLMSYGLTYLMKAGGQQTESDYPYQNKQGTCHFDKSKVAAKVVSCNDYKLTSEEALKELLYKEGPLAIAAAATTWLQYKNGIWNHCSDTDIDHGVLLVGYGSENGEDYWIIKNSWGSNFGEKGYIRLKRGVKCNAIGGIGQDKPFAVTAATVA